LVAEHDNQEPPGYYLTLLDRFGEIPLEPAFDGVSRHTPLCGLHRGIVCAAGSLSERFIPSSDNLIV
jgi:hypothetical protein